MPKLILKRTDTSVMLFICQQFDVLFVSLDKRIKNDR